MGIVSRERSVLPTLQTGLSKHISLCGWVREAPKEASVLVGSTGGQWVGWAHINLQAARKYRGRRPHVCARRGEGEGSVVVVSRLKGQCVGWEHAHAHQIVSVQNIAT